MQLVTGTIQCYQSEQSSQSNSLQNIVKTSLLYVLWPLFCIMFVHITLVCSILSIIYKLNISLNSLVELVDGTNVECLCLFMAVQFEHLAAVMEQDGRALFLSE